MSGDVDKDRERSNLSAVAVAVAAGELTGGFQPGFAGGAVMGGVVHTIVVPVERSKLLQQTQESNLAVLRGGRRKFNGMLDCIVRTVREEGFLSLWRGNESSVLRYYPSDLYKNILRSSDSRFLSGPSAKFIAGSSAGCTTLFIIHPLDIAHAHLAADIGCPNSCQFRRICHFLVTFCRKEGIQGIYRGLPSSLQGMVVHRGLYFGGFDTMKEFMAVQESKRKVELWKRWMAVHAVTTLTGLMSYPLHTVRRRMMMPSGLDTHIYSSTLDCWRAIYRTEGVASFYGGPASNAFRSTNSTVILVLYDEVQTFLTRERL